MGLNGQHLRRLLPRLVRVNCDCAIAGSTLRTSTRGASLSYCCSTVAGPHFALLMATGPARGRADIYFDDRLATTVDTYPASTTTAS